MTACAIKCAVECLIISSPSDVSFVIIETLQSFSMTYDKSYSVSLIFPAIADLAKPGPIDLARSSIEMDCSKSFLLPSGRVIEGIIFKSL